VREKRRGRARAQGGGMLLKNHTGCAQFWRRRLVFRAPRLDGCRSRVLAVGAAVLLVRPLKEGASKAVYAVRAKSRIPAVQARYVKSTCGPVRLKDVVMPWPKWLFRSAFIERRTATTCGL